MYLVYQYNTLCTCVYYIEARVYCLVLLFLPKGLFPGDKIISNLSFFLRLVIIDMYIIQIHIYNIYFIVFKKKGQMSNSASAMAKTICSIWAIATIFQHPKNREK